MTACGWLTKKGSPCAIPVEDGAGWCHLHDPESVYARQHPKYRSRLLVAQGRPADDPEAYWRDLVACHSCETILRRAFGPGCHRHGGGRRGRSLAQAIAEKRAQGMVRSLNY